jgi:hypothetical protein
MSELHLPHKVTIDLIKFRETNPEAWEVIADHFRIRSAATIELTKAELQELKPEVLEQLLNPKESQAKREAAIARLENYWEKEKGLLNTKENADALLEMLRFLNRGFTVESIDRAIVNLKELNRLQWKSDEKPAPAPPAAVPAAQPPAPPASLAVRKLKNGEDELPLDADVFTMKRASKEQLLDLSKRRGEGQKQFRQGWFRSRQ